MGREIIFHLFSIEGKDQNQDGGSSVALSKCKSYYPRTSSQVETSQLLQASAIGSLLEHPHTACIFLVSSKESRTIKVLLHPFPLLYYIWPVSNFKVPIWNYFGSLYKNEPLYVSDVSTGFNSMYTGNQVIHQHSKFKILLTGGMYYIQWLRPVSCKMFRF